MLKQTDSRREAALAQLVYIALPEAYDREISGFRPQPGIRIPVETAGKAENFDPALITGEAIVAGMMRLLAWEPDHEHAAYYRSFVRAVKPELLSLLSEAGVLKARSRDWDVAEEIFLALAGIYPEAPEPLIDLAILYEDRAESLAAAGQEEEAERLDELAFERYKTLLAQDPPFPEAFFNAAFFFLRRKNYERAASLLESYVKLGPEGERRDRAEEALAGLREQGYLDELFKEAFDFIRLGRDAEGLEKAELFLAKNPTVWNAWFLKGWALRRLSRWEEGRRAFERALALGAEGSDVRNELSICLLELGLVDEAREQLGIALEREPENIKIITNLGAVALRQGRLAEAIGFFRTVLEIEPEDRAAASWLARAEAAASDEDAEEDEEGVAGLDAEED